MPFSNKFSYEQTIVLRTALDIVLSSTDESRNEMRRKQVASVLIGLMKDDEEFDAATLAQLAIEKLGKPEPATRLSDSR
jgi:hypothetical protein